MLVVLPTPTPAVVQLITSPYTMDFAGSVQLAAGVIKPGDPPPSTALLYVAWQTDTGTIPVVELLTKLDAGRFDGCNVSVLDAEHS